MQKRKRDSIYRLNRSSGTKLFMLVCAPFLLAANSRDIELEKVSNEQKIQIQNLEASLSQSSMRFKEEIEAAHAEKEATAEALAKQTASLEATQSEVDEISSNLQDLKNNPKPRYDQITFANGLSFVGRAVRYENNLITIQSASGEEKTGSLSIMKNIDFHLTGLTAEEFPFVQKRAATTPQKNSHAKVMARFSPNLVFAEVKRGDRNPNGQRSHGEIQEDVQLKVTIGYKNPQSKLEGCKLEVFALGRDLENKKLGEIILQEKFRLKPIGPSGEKVETAIERISFYKYNYSKDVGIVYYGYLIVLKDRQGKIIHTKGSRSSIEKMYSKLRNLDAGDSFSY